MRLTTDNKVDSDQLILILEKSGSNLEVKKDGDHYILEGIAAIFGEENNNHRIYEEKEYLPHLEYLQEKIKQNRLVGELDHPEKFDISLKHISHIVEKLEYNKENRQLKIRVKLLDTPAGKIAKTLVDANVPISISSRAAGVVSENKKVKIKKIFTYDLVADPGFEKAQLERIYESCNSELAAEKKKSIINNLQEISENFDLKNQNTKIYSINENDPLYKKAMESDRKITGSEMNQQFVTVEEMNDYSAILQKELTALKEKMKAVPASASSDDAMTKIEERLNKIEKYTKYLAENIDKNIQYSEYLAENVDKNIEYSKYLAENLDKNISYAEYLAENLDGNISYAEYLAENLDKTITFADYLAENLERGISYSEYLAENLDRNISYSEYLAENLDKNISYSEYLAESMDKGIAYSEYIGEKLEKNIAYAEYIAENVSITPAATVNEEVKPAGEVVVAATEVVEAKAEEVKPAEVVAETTTPVAVEETAKVEEIKTEEKIEESDNYKGLTDKINLLLENAKNQKAVAKINESKYTFFRFLSEEKRGEFTALDEAKKEKVVNALKDGAYFSEADILTKWEKALIEKVDETPKFLKLIPEGIKPLYEALSLRDKQAVIAQSKIHKLETEYQISNFWNTRPFVTGKKVGLIKLNENESAASAATAPSMKGYSSEYMTSVADELAKRFRK